MTSTTLSKQTIFITEDTYVSSDTPDTNEYKIPLLNIGRSENGNVNRALLKIDFGNLDGRTVEEAVLCMFQMHIGNNASPNDALYIHAVTREWSEERVTWNELGSSPIGTLVSENPSVSIEGDMKLCFNLDPKEVKKNNYGYILKGDEVSDRHDRWFRSSEFIKSNLVTSRASSDTYHPHVLLVTREGGDGSPIGLIIGLVSGGLVALALLGFGIFMCIRRRNAYDDDESSIESEEPEKDFVDNLGEVFGVNGSSTEEEDETLYTRNGTPYGDNETAMSEDYTYDNDYRR
jgi:hypothetical protein